MPSALRERTTEKKWSNLIASVLACALPVALLILFISMWHGLVPASTNEQITKHQQGINPAAFAYALALLGVFAPPYLLAAGIKKEDFRSKLVPIFMLIALVIAFAFPTSWHRLTRDYGWLWRAIVRPMPDVMDRSLVITILAIVGGASLALLTVAIKRAGKAREGVILSLTMLGWLCAQSLNSMAWQKYFEQILLIALAWAAALAMSGCQEKTSPIKQWGGVWMLASAQFLFSAAKFFKQGFLDG